MSIIKANGAGDQSTGFYNNVGMRSLRGGPVNGSSFLSQTFSAGTSTGSGDTCTLSCWVKRVDVPNTGYNQYIFTAGAASDAFTLWFSAASDQLIFRRNNGAVTITTSRYFRDPTAWFNIVLRIKTSESSDDDKYQIWINGLRETVTRSGTPVTTFLGVNSQIHNVLKYPNGSSYGNMYLSDMNFVDGLALDASYFGEFKKDIWIAKNPNVSNYGTNGFRFKFDKTGLGTGSASTIGADSSGKNNHFDSSGIVASDCAMIDTPENNFCTMNPLEKGSNSSFFSSKGSLRMKQTADDVTCSTFAFDIATSKLYAEFLIVTSPGASTGFGITVANVASSISDVSGANAGNYHFNAYGQHRHTSYSSGYGASVTTGDVVGIRIDEGSVYFYKNGTILNSSAAFSSLTGEFFFSIAEYSGTNVEVHANFGQDFTFSGYMDSSTTAKTPSNSGNGTLDDNNVGRFFNAPPSGHVALCAENLPEPVIGPNSDTKASDHFDVLLWDGNGSNKTVTGAAFKGDWLWSKDLTGTENHVWIDTSRGLTKRLTTNSSAGDTNDTNATFTSFNAPSSSGATDGGFTLTQYHDQNVSSSSNVGWLWKANGGTTSTNDASSTGVGATDSVIQANTIAGFSIVTYTGTGSTTTIKHGLQVNGVAAVPEVMIIKNRDASHSWAGFYHHLMAGSAAASATDYLSLDGASNLVDDATMWADTPPTDTVFTVGSASNTGSSDAFVGYFFKGIDGYSKFGTYVADASIGPFVFLGFRPSFIIIKNTSNGNNWTILDDTRFGVGTTQRPNPILSHLAVNTTSAEFDSDSYPLCDFTAGGFRIRLGGTGSTLAQNVNRANGDIYIYLAFAHSPFKYSNAF